MNWDSTPESSTSPTARLSASPSGGRGGKGRVRAGVPPWIASAAFVLVCMPRIMPDRGRR
jgi:hypothetical protein